MSTPARRGRPRKLPLGEQRERVLRAAASLYALHGEQATIEQIARQAGVSRQSVYESFGDRAALFTEVVADVEERSFVGIVALAREKTPNLRAWARMNYANMFAFVAANPEAFPVLREAERLGNPALTRLRERLAGVYTEVAKQRWAEHGVDAGRSDNALVTLYFAMTEALVQMTWDGQPPDADALIDLLTEFTVGGITRLREPDVDVIDRLR
ncbi:DNA-binding transcriptional regulator, AcrR family [Amycolatopsis xylanica]|uniref:DNA-binding transcriptional regulator, AcrR family n=1 Tax=Amycolatopsis xylanica TaxID=589385 RepID=A0A1H3A2H3_9PSEU|nr:TetR/AcrR family transcriptional regulator [Amycolatopsis xylanica]SDX23394.1 DNA-binding transcriptional regulator, AcrR family [Amycolatopsis xylanica]